jgi:hypothetical protein
MRRANVVSFTVGAGLAGALFVGWYRHWVKVPAIRQAMGFASGGEVRADGNTRLFPLASGDPVDPGGSTVANWQNLVGKQTTLQVDPTDPRWVNLGVAPDGTISSASWSPEDGPPPQIVSDLIAEIQCPVEAPHAPHLWHTMDRWCAGHGEPVLWVTRATVDDLLAMTDPPT